MFLFQYLIINFDEKKQILWKQPKKIVSNESEQDVKSLLTKKLIEKEENLQIQISDSFWRS